MAFAGGDISNSTTTYQGTEVKNQVGNQITNSGTIDASKGIHSVKLVNSHYQTITNTGTMKGQWNGISIEEGSTVNTINNSGTISAQKQYGIYVAGQGSIVNNIINTGTIEGPRGIFIDNGQVGSIDNQGNIWSSGSGIFTVGGKVDKIHHSGNITGVDAGMRFEKSTIGDVVIDRGAQLNAIGTTSGAFSSSGIRIERSTVNSISNAGAISGVVGVHIMDSDVGTFNNSGQIIATDNSALVLTQWGGKSHIGQLINSGIIQSRGGQGIYLEPTSSIDSIVNSGKIIGSGAGISNWWATGTEVSHIGEILVQYGGLIQGQSSDGIMWVKQGGGTATIDRIQIDNGGTISAKKSGIWIDSGAKLGQLVVYGNLLGEGTGIYVDGTVGTGDVKDKYYGYAIWVGDTGLVQSSGGYGIVNAGTLNGGISVAGAVGSTNQRSGIHNKGTITALSNQNGINVTGTVTSILNQGKINATQGIHGIKIAGSKASVGLLENEGDITGDWHGISIETGATVKSMVNRGTISGLSSASVYINEATVGSFVNESTISGPSIAKDNLGSAVAFDDATVGTFTNKGTLIGQQTHGVIVTGDDASKVVGAIINSGTIEGKKGFGIAALNQGHIGTIEVSGKVTGATSGIGGTGHLGAVTIKSGGRVEGLANNGFEVTAQGDSKGSFTSLTVAEGGALVGKQSSIWVGPNATGGQINILGAITGAVTNEGHLSYDNGYAIAVGGTAKLDVSSAAVINNMRTGVIDGGVAFADQSIGNKIAIQNDGTITNGTSNARAGIYVHGVKALAVDNNQAVIQRNAQANVANATGGILVASSTLTRVANRGTITASDHGLYIKSSTVTNVAQTGQIVSKVGDGVALHDSRISNLQLAGTIKAGQNAVGIYGGLVGTNSASQPAISFDKSVKLSGQVAGFANEGGKIFGDLSLQGSIKGGKYGFYSSGVINGDVYVGAGLDGGVYDFYNKGTITGTVTYNNVSEQTVNLGNVKDVKFLGQAAVNIDNVGVKAGQAVSIYADNAQNVHVNSVTVADSALAAQATQKGVATADLVKVNGVGVNAQNLHLDRELEQLGFTATLSDDGVVKAAVDTASTTGGLLGQTVANQTMRRDFTVDALVGEALQSAQFNSRGQDASSAFVKPYGSSDRYDISNATMDGSTYGVVAGANWVANDIGFTAFVGYERSDLDANYVDSRLALKSDTVYVGATGFAEVTKMGNAQIFVKSGVKAALTRHSLDRSLATTYSQTDVNSVNWGGNVQVGMNYALNSQSVITPSVGVGLTSLNLDNFGLTHEGGQGYDEYSLQNSTIPYGEVAIEWNQAWTDQLRTQLGAGARVLMDRSQTLDSIYNGANVSGQYNLSISYEYVTANVGWKVTPSNEISIGYVGVFEGNGQSHNMTAKYEYLF